jgi:hypothetical protein
MSRAKAPAPRRVRRPQRPSLVKTALLLQNRWLPHGLTSTSVMARTAEQRSTWPLSADVPSQADRCNAATSSIAYIVQAGMWSRSFVMCLPRQAVCNQFRTVPCAVQILVWPINLANRPCSASQEESPCDPRAASCDVHAPSVGH